MNQLIDNAYFQDIMNQPQAVRATLDGLQNDHALLRIPDALARGKLRRIVLTGMGSSFHALYPLFLTLANHGFAVQLIETAELVHYARGLIAPATLLIAVSQSGRSAEILRLLEVNAASAPLIAITNSPESPLAQAADEVVLTRAGEEFSVSCKTYVTALAALAWLGDALTGQSPQGTLAALEEAAAGMTRYLAAWPEHLRVLSARLQPIHFLNIVGRGPSLAAVGTASLIIKESARFPALGLSSAAFRHGPLEMIDERHFTLVYAGLSRTRPLNLKLAEDVRRIGGGVDVVDRSQTPGAFALPPVPDAALPLMEILPAQMISLALARLHGHEPGVFTHASKVTMAE